MTENKVNCGRCANKYFNPFNCGIYCGAFIEGKEGIHIIESRKRKDGKWIDVFDCKEFKEIQQMKLDLRTF